VKLFQFLKKVRETLGTSSEAEVVAPTAVTPAQDEAKVPAVTPAPSAPSVASSTFASVPRVTPPKRVDIPQAPKGPGAEDVLRQIGGVAKALMPQMTSSSTELPQEALNRADVQVLMLAYKIVSVAMAVGHEGEPSREVVRAVRAGMVNLLLKAGRDHFYQLERMRPARPVPPVVLGRDQVEEHLRQAEADILMVAPRVRSSHDLESFSALVPAQMTALFGGVDARSICQKQFAVVIQWLARLRAAQ